MSGRDLEAFRLYETNTMFRKKLTSYSSGRRVADHWVAEASVVGGFDDTVDKNNKISAIKRARDPLSLTRMPNGFASYGEKDQEQANSAV